MKNLKQIRELAGSIINKTSACRKKMPKNIQNIQNQLNLIISTLSWVAEGELFNSGKDAKDIKEKIDLNFLTRIEALQEIIELWKTDK